MTQLKEKFKNVKLKLEGVIEKEKKKKMERQVHAEA